MKIKTQWLPFPMILIILASCNWAVGVSEVVPSASVSLVTQSGENSSRTPENTMIPTMQALTSISPSFTVTSKLKTDVPSVTRAVVITPSITVSPYPIRDLSDNEKLKVMDLLDYKGDCELPCWNGVTPGFSQVEEIQGFYARLGYDTVTWPPHGEESDGNEEIKMVGFPQGSLKYDYFYISLRWEKKIVNQVEIDLWAHPEQYTIDRIINRLGTPTNIKVINGIGGKKPVYAIGLLYDEKNLVIEIRGNLVANNNDNPPYLVCINNEEEQYVKVTLYAATEKNEVEKDYQLDPWEEWAKSIGISNNELIQELLDPSHCVLYP